LPEEIPLTVSAQTASDLPLELRGIDVRSAFYRVQPDDTAFASPVTVTRRVSLSVLNVDLGSEGLPVLVLALRSPSAAWEWLENQRLTTEGDLVIVSGEASQTGTLFAFGGTTFTRFELDPRGPTSVGSSVVLTASLEFPDDATDPPRLGSGIEAIVGADFVTAGAVSGPLDDTLSQEFECDGVGSTFVGVRYEIQNVGAESALFNWLGLAPASTTVTAPGVVNCVAPRPSDAGPSTPDP
jgi:hypothetical protein